MIKERKIEDVRIIFRNFTGEEGMYNRKGDRNFAIVIPEDLVQDMLNEGWNVKRLKVRDDDPKAIGDAYVSVAINFKNRPPLIKLITRKGGNNIQLTLPEDQLDALDWVEIETADVVINPFEYNINGNSGVKAYLKELFITQAVSVLEEKYSHIPELDPFTNQPLAIEGDSVVEGEIVD